jgi:hypothetical protein
MPLEDKGLKRLHFTFVFIVLNLTRKASLSFNLKNVSLLMGWAFLATGSRYKVGLMRFCRCSAYPVCCWVLE